MASLIHARKYDLGFLNAYTKTTTAFCGKRITNNKAVVHGEITCPECQKKLAEWLKINADMAKLHPELFSGQGFQK
jgi:L-arabinose isomerase